MEFEKKVIVDVDGVIEKGKQFDLDLRLQIGRASCRERV